MSDPIDPRAVLRAAAEARSVARVAERVATETLRVAVVEAHSAGVSMYEIERITGLASATVRRWCKDNEGEEPKS